VIAYDIASTSSLELKVYDAQGRLVKTLSSGVHGPGSYEITWNGDTQTGQRSAPGVYFYSLKTDGGPEQTQKVVLVK
jgi:flagellar hook assembly protein FlgD